MPEAFLNEAHHVAMLGYDFGRKWQQDQQLPRSEFQLLVQALEAVPIVNTADPRYAPALQKLREVKRLTEQLAHPGWDTNLGPEFCSAGLALLDVIKNTSSGNSEWLNWMEQSRDSPAPTYSDNEEREPGQPKTHKAPKFVAGKPVPCEETRHCEFKETKGGNPVNSIKNTCDEYVVAFLNSDGGRILWGVRDSDRCVVGVTLKPNDRNDLRRVVTDKLMQIRPPIAPTAYKISLHPVHVDEISTEPILDMFVVEIVAPRSDSVVLHATGGNEIYVRTDAGKKRLTPEEIQDEARRREASRRLVSQSSYNQVPFHYRGQLPAYLPPNLKSDRKNILRDSDISARLLRGEPPSLAECVMASRTVTIELRQKNRPLDETLPYNHFMGPSAVFSLRDPTSGRLIRLGYTRAAQPRDPGFRLTTGAAILWNASYNFDLAHEKGTPMDLWIERVAQDRAAAVRTFASGPECTFLQILRYKIELVDLDAVCEPFGVITNDLRNRSEGRVYTQYVFHVTLAASFPADVSALLSRVQVRRGGHIYPLAADFRGDELVGQDGQKNPMEYVAWEALHNNKATLTYETARFTRGFVVA